MRFVEHQILKLLLEAAEVEGYGCRRIACTPAVSCDDDAELYLAQPIGPPLSLRELNEFIHKWDSNFIVDFSKLNTSVRFRVLLVPGNEEDLIGDYSGGPGAERIINKVYAEIKGVE